MFDFLLLFEQIEKRNLCGPRIRTVSHVWCSSKLGLIILVCTFIIESCLIAIQEKEMENHSRLSLPPFDFLFDNPHHT